MGKTSSISKNKYASKTYDRIQIITRKGEKAELQSIAQAHGQSLNAYIIEAIKEKRERDGNSEGEGRHGLCLGVENINSV